MLKGENILLRAMEPADITVLFDWENDENNWHISNTHAPFSKYLLEQFISSENDIFTNKQIRFMIVETTKNTTIGTVDLFEFDPLNLKAGVGILMAKKEYREKGLAKKALKLVIEYAFNRIKMHQLFCHIQETNTKSIQLFKSLEFEITGTKKDWSINDGKWEQQHFLQLINK